MATHDQPTTLLSVVGGSSRWAEAERPCETGELSRLIEGAHAMPVEVIPALLGDVERLKAILWARLNSREAAQPDKAEPEDDLLMPEDAARLLGVAVRWLYRHQKQLPFTRRLSRKTLRFSRRGLMRWLAARRV